MKIIQHAVCTIVTILLIFAVLPIETAQANPSDPYIRQTRLVASNADMLDEFGSAVAMSGDTLVVGAPIEASDGSSESDNSLHDAGAAYVFVRNGHRWVQQAYLKASNPGVYDKFGRSVAISGDTILVGAPYEDGDGSSENDNSAIVG